MQLDRQIPDAWGFSAEDWSQLSKQHIPKLGASTIFSSILHQCHAAQLL